MKKLNFAGNLLNYGKKEQNDFTFHYIVNTFIPYLHIIYGTSRLVGGKGMLKTSDLNMSDTQMLNKIKDYFSRKKS
jgi:hypothetical protein